MERDCLDAAAQGEPLRLGERVGFGIRCNAAQPQYGQDQLCRQQGVENVPQIPVGTLCQVTLDALIQLFRRQTGFQVDLQPVVLRAALSHESACAEYQRTGYAEVGEQHFAQIFKDAFFAPVQPQGHVPQGKPHGIPAPVLFGDQRDQRGHRRHDGVTCLFCQIACAV